MGADDGFERRPLTPDQARAWARLLAVIARADGDDEVFGEADLLEDFDDPRCDFARGSLALYDGDVMAGWNLLTFRENTAEIRQSGGVHPGYRGRGLGSELLAWSEQSAMSLHSRPHRGQPLSLIGECLQRNKGAMKLYASRGYEPVRWFLLMECDLSAVDLAGDLGQPPGDVTIAGFSLARSADARLIVNEAFRDHWGTAEQTEQEWDHFVGLGVFRPGYSYLCYLGGEQAGALIAHEYEAYNATNGGRDLYISTVGTLRSARRRGIGTALLVAALRAARADGFKSASLNVDADSPTGAVGIYERLGFKVTNTSVSLQKQFIAS